MVERKLNIWWIIWDTQKLYLVWIFLTMMTTALHISAKEYELAAINSIVVLVVAALTLESAINRRLLFIVEFWRTKCSELRKHLQQSH